MGHPPVRRIPQPGRLLGMRPPLPPPATNPSSVLYCCIYLARSRCRRCHHGARQSHHPALVHHHPPTGETPLLHAAETRRCRHARCHAAPPSRTPPVATGPIPSACSSSNRAPKRPRRRLQEGYDTRSVTAARSKEILGFHPGMGSGWRAGISTAPARRRTVTLVVAIVRMNESSGVSSSPMSPPSATANAPRPTIAIVSHQVQRERACSAEIHRQLTAHAVKTPSIHPPRTSPAEGAACLTGLPPQVQVPPRWPEWRDPPRVMRSGTARPTPSPKSAVDRSRHRREPARCRESHLGARAPPRARRLWDLPHCREGRTLRIRSPAPPRMREREERPSAATVAHTGFARRRPSAAAEGEKGAGGLLGGGGG
ncbi:zinc finger CCCH domain-containing protein 18-like [Triticum urartu]|uniref:zinc finger CCCH domain-containing protein 18-like n=1 Tax=Triticum urartu TaxID=4572 RepID=UPI002044CAE3|nr:zinc finger CCCH domain-containing protein 18-like [Triticum urartu]XP_048570820.1 zinc finger CCCH domain-containing protein 18-like [Triticum urartu]XP_048570821.1 zinc finger CCCH domain-containing protein 18-like [Triticum urartu]XP_048570822.1 zinc finger CCCH domain-containing protein 18-like [Triticum urartu]